MAPHLGVRRRPAAASGVALAAAVTALAVAIALPLLHPWPPHQPNSDLYTHLATARHLARGEGFVTDAAYPLSLAYPFARRLPQPLLHQGPGYPLLLVPAVAAAGAAHAETGSEPWLRAALAAERLVPWLGLLLVAGTAALGAAAAARRGLPEAGAPWAILLACGPAVGLSVAWGRVEIPAALLLLAAWLRWREAPPAGAPAGAAAGGALDGALAAAPALLRPDLAWVPLLWFAALPRGLPGGRLLTAAAVWLALLAPWGIRNAVLTGNPLFALQTSAEHLKDTRAWPGYAIYRSLSPEPLPRTLARDPGPVLRKTARGARFYARELGGLLPWGVWAAGLALGVAAWRAGRGRRLPRRGEAAGRAVDRRPLALAGATIGLLALQYSPFDHDVRHLVPVLPVAAWEVSLGAASRLRRLLSWGAPARAAALAAAALLLWAASPPRLPGWGQAARGAAEARPRLEAAVPAAADLPPGPILTDAAAVAWRAGRTAVWLPLDGKVEAEVRRLVPELREAPVVLAGELPAREPTRDR